MAIKEKTQLVDESFHIDDLLMGYGNCETAAESIRSWEEKVYNSIETALKTWVEGKIEYPDMNVTMFLSNEQLVRYVTKKYIKDKEEYLKTGKWPKVKFHYNDKRSDKLDNYYYLLRIMDTDIELDNYLDVEYDSKKYPKNFLIQIILEYNASIIPFLRYYVKEQPNQSFYQWYMENKMIIKKIINPLNFVGSYFFKKKVREPEKEKIKNDEE